MKKIFFMIFIASVLQFELYSQVIDSVYWIKVQTSLYSSCDTKIMIGLLNKDVKVYSKSSICTDNTLESQMLKIKTSDGYNRFGWVYFEDLISSKGYHYDSLQRAIRIAKQIEIKRVQDSVNYIRDSLNKIVRDIEKMKSDSIYEVYNNYLHKKSFWVTDISAYDYTDQSEGIIVKFLNTSKKTIKYINFTVVPYNRVNDAEIDNMGHSFKNCQLIGPIVPDEEATYQQDIIFFSNVIDYYKLKNISVQYLDNTIKYFNYSDIILNWKN